MASRVLAFQAVVRQNITVGCVLWSKTVNLRVVRKEERWRELGQAGWGPRFAFQD